MPFAIMQCVDALSWYACAAVQGHGFREWAKDPTVDVIQLYCGRESTPRINQSFFPAAQ